MGLLPNEVATTIKRSISLIESEQLADSMRRLSTVMQEQFAATLPDYSASLDLLQTAMLQAVPSAKEFQARIAPLLLNYQHLLKGLSDSFSDLRVSPDQSSSDPFITDGRSSIGLKQSKDAVVLKAMFSDITWEECCDFLNHISNFPMLSFMNPIGQKIFGLVSDAELGLFEDRNLFRVRKHEYSKRHPYTDNEMFEPPYKSTQQHRFSSNGQNYLYTSDSLTTAELEVGLVVSDHFTWIEMKLLSSLRLLDIRDRNIPLFDNCHAETNGNANLSTEYLLPNFIADCAKKSGFNGILYESVLDSGATNIVFFDVGRRDFSIVNRGTEQKTAI